MSLIDFHARAEQALRHFRAQPMLQEAVQAETDAFFKRFPDLERTELTAAFIGALVIEKISAGADSQSVPSTETQNKKVA